MEERLNLKMEYYRKQVVYDNRLDINKEITASVMAGDAAYDLYIGRNIVDLMLSGDYLLDLSENAYINFDKPWWNRSQLDMMPGNRTYVASGDGTLSIIRHTFCIFFNNTRLNSFGVGEDMYTLVNEGKWTIDKLAEITRTGYNDANGNNTADYGDEFGLTFGDTNKFLGFQYAMGGECVVKGRDSYELVYGSEKMNSIFDKFYALVYNTEGVLMPGGNVDTNTLAVPTGSFNYVDKTFMEGKSMFTASLVDDASTILADVSFEYGILPYPKFDEKQENYISAPQRNSFFAMLSYCDTDFSGAALEAWCSEAYRTIQPEYFEITLKVRYSADDNMSAVMDLLRSTTRYEIGDYFTQQLNSITSSFKNLIVSGSEGQWASNYAFKEQMWNKALGEIWETLS